MKLLSMVAALCVALSACQVVDSSRNTVTTVGPASADERGLVGLFKVTYERALKAQKAAYETNTVANSQESYRDMAEAGFGLVRANCSEFFSNRGEDQKWIQFGSGLVALGGALATGLLAITGTSALAVSIVALSTATSYSSIDVYTKNFLFGAENIDAVRVLTMRTLGEDATESLSTPIGRWSFSYSVNAIMANQEICKPASILALTRQAIRSSTIKAADSTGVSDMDTLRKEMIGQLARPGGIRPTETEVAALCWAANYSGSNAASDEAIYVKATKTFPRGPNNPGEWTSIKAKVKETCKTLSAPDQAYVDRLIVEMRSGGTLAEPATTTPVAAPAKATTNTLQVNK